MGYIVSCTTGKKYSGLTFDRNLNSGQTDRKGRKKVHAISWNKLLKKKLVIPALNVALNNNNSSEHHFTTYQLNPLKTLLITFKTWQKWVWRAPVSTSWNTSRLPCSSVHHSAILNRLKSWEDFCYHTPWPLNNLWEDQGLEKIHHSSLLLTCCSKHSLCFSEISLFNEDEQILKFW